MSGASSLPRRFSHQLRFCLTLAAFLSVGFTGHLAGQSRLRFSLPSGQYAPGFRAVELWDASRTFGDSISRKGRPLQVSVWYPAMFTDNGHRMRYREYAQLITTAGELPRHDAPGRAAAESLFVLYYGTGDTVNAQHELNAMTGAILDAPVATGSFPIVVYGPSFNAVSFENNVLMEYLASHGYIVVASPSWGPAGDMTSDFTGVETQARDMEFLLQYARGLPSADPDHVAVMGFSWGGISDVLMAMRNTSVRALVCLDGSIAYWYQRVLKGGPFVSPDRLVIPSLFLKQKDRPLTAELRQSLGADTTFAFFSQLRYADAYLVTMQTLAHQNFGAVFDKYAQAAPYFVGDTAVVNQGYERLAGYVRGFLDAELKSSGNFDSLLGHDSSAGRGVTVVRRRPFRPLRTIADFTRVVGSRGLNASPSVLGEIRKADPEYVLPQNDLEVWGYRLLRSGQSAEAIGVLQMNTLMYPKSAEAWYNLGEAYFRGNDRALATATYERIMGIDSAYAPAIARLKQLRKP